MSLQEENNTQNIYNKIQRIINQTDYDTSIAIVKLTENNYNEELVIKKFFGIQEKEKEKKCSTKDINQEIYKQLRYKLNNSMFDYIKRKEQN